MSPPRVIVTKHAIDRYLRRSGLHLDREHARRVIASAVETNEWRPLDEPRKALVPLQTEDRWLYALIVEEDGVIHVVTVLNAGQVAGGVSRGKLAL